MQNNSEFISFNNTLKKFLLLFMVLAISACSGSDSPAPVGVGNGLNGGDANSNSETTVDVGTITVAANPTTVTINGTSSVTVAVQDTDGNDVPDGTLVSFSLSDSSLGSIGSAATTYNGIATAAFTAATKAGIVSVTAVAGSVTSSPVNITVNGADAGSIAFESATPPVVGIKGTGQNEVSIIKFAITDINGNPVLDGTAVDVCMSGPSSGPRLPDDGGAYINEMDNVIELYTDANGNGCYDTAESYTDANGNGVYDSPLHATVSTVDGEATVFLHSGLVAGNVKFFATLVDAGLTSSTPTLSIGGGVPDYAHFSVVRDTKNLAGLSLHGEESNLTVFIADRFGNANVLEGTTVSFYAESGATVTSSAVLDDKGTAGVVFRTQYPIPYDVAPLPWETALINRVLSDYGISGSGNPRDGLATVTVGVIGEEDFDDANGNGMYDSGETYTDTQDELFLDANDNATFDDGTGTDPFELYVDNNGSGAWDGANVQWDSSKTLFTSTTLLITGAPVFIALNPRTVFYIPDEGSLSFVLLVSDINLNPLIADSTVKVEADVGKLTGITNWKFSDTASLGPLEIGFTLSDNKVGDTDPAPEAEMIKVTVNWRGQDYIIILSGEID